MTAPAGPSSTHMRALLVLLAVAGLTAPARADEPEPDSPKSLPTAFAWSLGTTAAGIGLIALGNASVDRDNTTPSDVMILGGGALALVGPSTGHWYTGKILTPGLVIRGTAMAGTLYAIFNDCGDCSDEDRQTIFLVGGAVFAAGAILDLATLPRAVERRNARRIVVAPTVIQDRLGVGIAGTF
jgi:hypothetical protein